MSDVEGKIMVGPKELRTTYLMPDGTQVIFRRSIRRTSR